MFVCASRPRCEMISNTRLHVGNYPVSHAVNTKTHTRANQTYIPLSGVCTCISDTDLCRIITDSTAVLNASMIQYLERGKIGT